MTAQLPGMPTKPTGKNDPQRVSEKDFSKTVMAALATFQWRASHCYALRTEHGWRTPTTSPGYPDIIAVRGAYLLALELKGYTARGDVGRLEPAQWDWLTAFAGVPTARAWVLKPTDDFDMFIRLLRFPQDADPVFGWDPASRPTAGVPKPRRPAVPRRLV